MLGTLVILLISATTVFAQSITLKGVVKDGTDFGMPGVNVLIKGTTIGSITDVDGNYSIAVPNDKAVLVFSFVGYASQEVAVSGKTEINVSLKEDSQQLDEVVVVGMGKQRRNTITAAVGVVQTDAIESRPVTDVTSALQGNVAGLNFASSASADGVGGETGADIKFNIRGIGSVNGGEPYVLVDGVEQSMQNVNPADIESISVLKDASASAVYGARAAYGVVLVTTKSGKQEKATVSYRGTAGFSSPINMPEMMNSLDFAHYYNQRDINMGRTPQFSNQTIENIKGFMNNPYSLQYPGIGINAAGDGWAAADYVQYANTDWFEYYFKDRAMRNSHNISIQGGSEKTTYYVGIGYINQQGLIDQVRDDLSKYNINTKLSVTAKEWLKFNLNNNVTLNLINRPLANQTIFYATIANTAPTRVTHLPTANSAYSTPTWNEMLYLKQAEYKQNRISDAMSFSATITPLEGWEIVGEMKARLDVENNSFKLGKSFYEQPNGEIIEITGTRQGYQYPGMSWKNTRFGSYTRGNLFNYYLSPNLTTSYTKQLGNHFFKAMLGTQMEVQENSSAFMYKDGMLSDDIYSFDNANGAVYTGEARTNWSTMGFFARFNWHYNNLYFVEVSGRYDGSSRFAANNRWGLFPSFSAGYDIARADYFTALDLPISQLKARVSYGRLGNQNGAGLYDYIGVMTLLPNDPGAWLVPDGSGTIGQGVIAQTPKMISPYITWEKVDNANFGIDAKLFSNKLSVTADIYERTTRDMIGPAEAIPGISGIIPTDRAKVNNATLKNRGWEFSAQWQDEFRNGISYGVGFNLFDYKAVVTKYNNPEGIIYNNHTGLERNQGYYEGMDVGEIWGFVADDLYLSNREINAYLNGTDLSFFKSNNLWQIGDLKYLDTNGDGKVDAGKGTLSDHGDLQVIGNATPRYSFGINLNVGYKGFSISTLFQGVGKRDFALAGSSYLFGGQNYFTDHLDYFSPSNPNGYLPRLTDHKTIDYRVNTGYNNTRYLMNAAYLRMKNLTLSYAFNKKVLKKMAGIGNLRVYFTCDNLFTISALPKAFDPETLNQVNTWAGGSNATAPGLTSAMSENGNGKVYPMNKNFVFGADITF
ncbi:MAG: SusC/RagA family TonB-linked outer membrane protein [Bacteroidales bacterium]